MKKKKKDFAKKVEGTNGNLINFRDVFALMLSREINYEREENKDVKWKVERWKNYERGGGSVFCGYKEVELRGVVADKNFFLFLEYYMGGARAGGLRETFHLDI